MLYAGGALITSDEIADVLSGYAAELARADTADALDVPGIGVDGTQQVFRLVVGPASQLFIEEAVAGSQIDSAAFLEDVAARREVLHAPPVGEKPLRFYDPL